MTDYCPLIELRSMADLQEQQQNSPQTLDCAHDLLMEFNNGPCTDRFLWNPNHEQLSPTLQWDLNDEHEHVNAANDYHPDPLITDQDLISAFNHDSADLMTSPAPPDFHPNDLRQPIVSNVGCANHGAGLISDTNHANPSSKQKQKQKQKEKKKQQMMMMKKKKKKKKAALMQSMDMAMVMAKTKTKQKQKQKKIECRDANHRINVMVKEGHVHNLRKLADYNQNAIADYYHGDNNPSSIACKSTGPEEGLSPVSKNLMSERRRRKKLNESLYSLRSIVPMISKMDKASIVTDAIVYVKDLQNRVQVMRTDVEALEAFSSRNRDCLLNSAESMKQQSIAPILKNKIRPPNRKHKILKLNVSHMEAQMYHLCIDCERSPGVLVPLTHALEALDFDILNANLTSVNDHVLNTLVIQVKGEHSTMRLVAEEDDIRQKILSALPKFGLFLLEGERQTISESQTHFL